MNGQNERLEVIFKARLYVSLGFSAGGAVLSLLINPAVLVPMLVLGLFECCLNQPYLYRRLWNVSSPLLARVHLYIDVAVITFAVHLFGGPWAGPIIAIYLLLLFYASVAVKPLEGVLAAAAILIAFFSMMLLENSRVVDRHVPLMSAEADAIHNLALVVTTVVVLVLPAFAGSYIQRMFSSQEQEMRYVLERSRRVFDNALNALLVLDHKGTVLRANQKAAELFQIQAQDLVGMNFTELLSAESVDEFAVFMENVSIGESVTCGNLQVSLPDDTMRIMELGASPYDRSPDPPGIFLSLNDVTGIKLMEDELRRFSEELYRKVEDRTAELEESRESYASLFEKAAAPLCWLDQEGTLRSANQAFFELTELGKNQEGSFKLVDIILDQGRRKETADYLERLKRGFEEPKRLELRIDRKDHGPGWTEWFIRFEPLTDQILVSMIDVTERKRAEEALKQSEQKFRTAVENLPFDFWMMDRSGRYVMINWMAKEHWGDVRGKTHDDLEGIIEEHTLDKWKRNNQRAFNGEVVSGEQEYDWQGEKLCFHEIVAPVYHDQEITGIMGVNIDMTQQRLAQEKLKESEERYRKLVETSPDAITMTDLTGKVIMANQRAARSYGVDKVEELIGKNALEFIAPEERDRAFLNAQKTLEQGSLEQIEYELLKADGSAYSGEISASLVRDASGEPMAFIGVARDISDRKRAEEALRLTQFSIDNAPDPVLWIDADARVQHVNEAACRHLDYSRDQLLRMTVADFDPDFPAERWPSHWEELRQKKRMVIESRNRRRNGDIIPVEISINLLEYGGKEYNFAFVRDITERKRAEEAIWESEKKYRTLFEESRDAVYITTREGLFVEVNPAAVEMFGYQREEMIGMDVRNIYADPADREKFQEKIERHGSVTDYGLKFRRKDGALIDCLLTSTVRKAEDGAILGYQGIIRDITMQKRARRELVQSERKYRTLIETSPDAIVMSDLKGEIIMANQKALDLWGGSSPEELRGVNVMELISPEDLDKVSEQMGRAIQGELVKNQELRVLRKDGSSYIAEASGNLLMDENDEPQALIGVLRDVTERKEREREQRLMSRQLDQARQMAAAGRMAAGVAHEMNNPITAITYYAQALEKLKKLNKKERERARHIKDSAENLQKLLARLINYAVEEKVQFEPVDLNTVVLQVLDALAHEFEEKPKIKVTSNTADDLKTVRGSIDQLFQLVSNLVVNALQALPGGEGELCISTRNCDGAVELEVRDTGRGIAKKDLEKIFTPFFTTNKQKGGTGLGLAIVDRVARLHNANIEVASRRGEGAAFKVVFPLESEIE